MNDPVVDTLISQISNWGRWGSEDQRGTVNYITAAARAYAASCVRTGEVISLALPLNRVNMQPHGDVRINPQHLMLQTGTDISEGVQVNSIAGWGYADDMIICALQAATHWDALSHQFYDYLMYNNRSCNLVDAAGAHANSVTALCNDLVGRGVLLDVAASKGVQCLEDDYAVTVADLQLCLERENVEVRTGDIVIIRTGFLGQAVGAGTWQNYTYGNEPGLSYETLPWLHTCEVAAVATDTWAAEVLPSGCSIMLPVHAAGIVHMGLTLGENFVLDELARACERSGKFDFLLSAAALPIDLAVSGLANPVAIL